MYNNMIPPDFQFDEIFKFLSDFQPEELELEPIPEAGPSAGSSSSFFPPLPAQNKRTSPGDEEECSALAGQASTSSSSIPQASPPGPSRRKRRKSVTVPASMLPDEGTFRIYVGDFDLYAMSLPFLQKIYLPDRSRPPHYEALFHKLLTLQAKPDYTARCYLAPPNDPGATAATEGRFENPTMRDPNSALPLDVALIAIDDTKGMAIRQPDRRWFVAYEWTPAGPGITAKLQLARPYQGIRGSSGTLKMKRVWMKGSPVREELFEGLFTFKVFYEESYKYSGYGTGDVYKYAFWAIRARTDELGGSLGLGPRREDDWLFKVS